MGLTLYLHNTFKVFLVAYLMCEAFCLGDGDKGSVSKNWCPQNESYTYWLPCQDCEENSKAVCASGERKITVGSGKPDCSYKLTLLDLTLELPGCRHSCHKSMFVAQCCPGYWGVDCVECPGGAANPCGGRGTCGDGIEGNGTCQCQDGITGYACEKCEDPNAYGPKCEETCQCQHGDCIGTGIHGNGSCDCHSGYEGQLCDKEILSCATYSCHGDAKCVEEDAGPKCHCKYGYTGNGTYCQEINTCESDPPCHENATCTPKGLGKYECACIENYMGDGFSCQPIDPCQVNFGDCDAETADCMYISPNKSDCVCYDGYIEDAELGGCVIEDLCPTKGQICDENANCSTIVPGEVSCQCFDGYIGDGKICYGNIIERIKDLNTKDEQLKGQLFQAIRLMQFAYKQELTNGGPFTLFLPIDAGFSLALKNHMFQDMFSDRDLARLVLRQHLIARPLRVEELHNQTLFYTLQGSSARLYYQRDVLLYNLHGDSSKAVLLKQDVIAANGLIHVIDQVMDKRPQISTRSRSVMEEMKRNGYFWRLQSVISKLKDPDIDELAEELGKDETGPWTVFLPKASAFDALLPGTMTHLLEQDRQKLYMILKNHIVKDGDLYATDLLSVHKFTSIGNTATTVNVTEVGRILLNNNVSILQTDIAVSNGIIHYVDGFLVPDVIDTILPRFCNEVTVKEVMGPCGPCHGTLHCQAKDDVPLEEKKYGCRYWVDRHLRRRRSFYRLDDLWGNDYFHDYNYDPWLGFPGFPGHEWDMFRDIGVKDYLEGCNRMCNRTKTVKSCCNGFHGEECYPCPGTHVNPCYGRGECLDGIDGNGTCVCDDEFTGSVCEFCKNPNMYGPGCNQTCKCLHGKCDNSVKSTSGRCKKCDDGYLGMNCDMKKEYCSLHSGLRCHAHAECLKKNKGQSDDIDDLMYHIMWSQRRMRRKRRKNRSYCKCKQGYKGNGRYCEEINPCTEGDMLCHSEATCIKTGPGIAVCKCDKGWVGDGYYCFPSTVCETHNACDDNAKCVNIGPGQSHCECNENYHGNGTYCLPVDMCVNNSAGCDQYATCNVTGPGQAICECRPGLAGDGFTCYGDIPFQLHNSPDLTEMKKFVRLIPVQQRFLSRMQVNFTLFAVNNSALADYLSREDSSWTNNEQNLVTLLRYHTTPVALSIDDLKQLDGDSLLSLAENFYLNVSTTPQGDVYINDAKILFPDMFALNGFIHIISQVLEPYPPPETLPTLGEMLDSKQEFSLFTYLLRKQDFTGKAMYSNKTRAGTIPLLPRKFTVLAPLNKVWRGVNDKYIMQRRFLSYFIIQGSLSKADLLNLGNTTLQTWIYGGTSQQMTVNVVDKQLYLDNMAVILSPSDLKINWGYVHGIDVLLNPVLNFCDEKCCDGYYGDKCAECPGGAENYCNKKGNCNDRGQCSCDSGYIGSACQMCAANKKCGQVDQCTMKNGNCHPFADCTMSKNGVTCKCMDGYIGDGYKCMSPCEIENGECHANATCQLQGVAVICQCLPEFEGDGYHCDVKAGLCEVENGGCSSRAQCSVVTNGNEQNVSCVCKSDYVGDGNTCNADLWQTLQEMAKEQPYMKQFLQLFRNPEHVKLKHSLQNDKDGDFTVFVPVSGNVSSLDASSFVCKSLVLLSNKLISGVDVLSMDNRQIHVRVDYNDSETDELEFKVNGVRVILKNIPATNGLIQMLETSFVPEPPEENTLKIMSKHSSKQRHLSILYAVLGLAGTAAVIVGLVMVVKRKWLTIVMAFDRIRDSGAFKFQKLDETTNESSISFQSGAFGDSPEDMLEELPCKT